MLTGSFTSAAVVLGAGCGLKAVISAVTVFVVTTFEKNFLPGRAKTMATLSRTAQQAVRAGQGVTKQIAVAWVFRSQPGKMQRNPYLTFNNKEAADAFMEEHPEGFYKVEWADLKKR